MEEEKTTTTKGKKKRVIRKNIHNHSFIPSLIKNQTIPASLLVTQLQTNTKKSLSANTDQILFAFSVSLTEVHEP